MTPWFRRHDGQTVLMVSLTQSQLMALRSVLMEHLQQKGHVEEFIDVVRDVKTTPEELLQLLMDQEMD